MNYACKLRTGSTLALVKELPIEQQLESLAAAGINDAEFSYSFDYYMNKLEFPKNSKAIARAAESADVGLWSIHLPFSRNLDISSLSSDLRAWAKYTGRTLIESAADIGVKIAVLHPSSEPITDEERPERMKYSRETIASLSELCARLGMTLAVENLPRTCLCNTPDEMADLLDGTGASVVFDTNHSLKVDNPAFIRRLTQRGLKIASLHISDYDFVDERHRIPGDGINDWPNILRALEENGYSGTLLYEVSDIPKDRKDKPRITPTDIAANQKWLKSLY